ncbi:hypothetical protein A2801_03915 [Candidatus Woesebacteria bacterium RIFCSPHIGHO2_01_FULL_41_10]|uniref:Phosphotyrosine protein phosphatase I domain-containing protein n=1 Tax=Candidatus Woesebacteria bacterium RIFCSPHIGHO2_01_FULL_41_10 TaxID=1802500 RepID=A0A1F7YQ32_9BACT|nr:MAG: hypothetical protein A2801_03915 [Candidatus Woesebacteria bacterium RIFCSPHIGHO2_01_FULL_41_10]
MAEGYYNHFSHNQGAISAGVDNVGAKYNYRPTDLIIEVMREDGVDISSQSVKQVSLEMLVGVTRIVVLCEPEICPVFIRDSSISVLYHQITDPAHSGREATIQIRNEIKELVKSLLTS